MTSSISCEPDDICPASTPTTPGLVMEAFDNNNPENSKNIFGLTVIGEGQSEPLPDFYNVSNKSKLILPLNTQTNKTEYRLIKDTFINDNGTPDDTSDDFIDGKSVLITINYSTKAVFVSRACGYKYIFENVSVQVDQSDPDRWIKSIAPVNPNQSVENETETQFILLH
ncbi:DUF6452 family protein [Gaetbulibacter aestuarii]